MTRVGLNLLYVVPGKVGGTEIYARELVGALARERPGWEYVVFCGREAGDSFRAAGWPANVCVVTLPVPSAIKPLRIAAELLWLPFAARRHAVSVLHSLGTTAPWWGRFVRVVTVHDLIYHHFPDTFPAIARFGLELVVPRSARRAHRVCADSQATKDDLVATYGIDPAKIDVVYLGLGMSEPNEVTPEHELRKRFDLDDRPVVLSVAAALAHKNVDGLLAAFARLDGVARADHPVLAIAGHAGREQQRLVDQARELGIADDVRFTGWVTASELEGLYRLARCFVYPSKFEGFGLPVLEAMARGVPVASSRATSLAEVAGDAALGFDPGDPDSIAVAMRRLLDDDQLASDMAQRGRGWAAGFTWERTAQATLASYARAGAA